MTAQRCAAIVFLLLAPWSSRAQSPPAKMAAEARIDLVAEESVGRLDEMAVLFGGGAMQPMSWVPREERQRSYTGEFPVAHFASSRFQARFVPAGDGTVEVRLMGPWEAAPEGGIFRQEIEWESLAVEGATPAREFKPGKSWHDAPARLTLKVKRGQAVAIETSARAALPPGFEEMKRLGSTTPAHAALRRYLRGVNLANDLEVPPGQDWGAHHDAGDLEKIAAAGFDHVRIPVGWHHYAGEGPEHRLPEAIFRRVDALVDAALANKLAVIVNIHHFDAFTSDPAGQREKFLALWRQLSAHYADRPAAVAFELLNEPHDKATTEVMNDIYHSAIREIRRTNPKRTIFVGPGQWNQTRELARLSLPDDDDNLIVTIHSYEPFLVTHQGAGWSGPDTQLTEVRFPGPPERPLSIPSSLDVSPRTRDWVERYNTLPAEANPSGESAFRPQLELARAWGEYYGRPIHLGEFGSYIKCDPASRARLVGAYRRSCEELGIGWCLWDWKAGFRYWDEEAGRPAEGMQGALFGESQD